MVPKCLSKFWRTLKMPLINCEINLVLTWSANCLIACTAIANEGATAIADTILYVPVTDSRQCKTIRSIKIRF